MAGNQSIVDLKPASQESVVNFIDSCKQMYRQNFNIRERMRQIDLAYAREQDLTVENQVAKQFNRAGDSNKIQNVTIPVVLPQVESAVAYQTSVFLTGVPIFGCVASPEYMDAAMQLETIIDDQAIRGDWSGNLQLAFRDAFRYNMAAVECNWEAQKTFVPVTDLAFDAKEAKPTETIWEGNVVKRLDPYNVFWDTRVPITEVPQRGEFAGYNQVMSRIELKDFIAKLPEVITANIKPAFESGYVDVSSNVDYYIPQINEYSYGNGTNRQGTNWKAWFSATNDTSTIDYKNSYLVTTIYGRILPSDFSIRVPAANTPQVWKFILINNSVLVYAERQTNAHKLLPILFMHPHNDGLSYQTKSLAENVAPLQQTASALMNSVLAARRRSIHDRTIYDPSKIDPRHMNTSNPIANIPVKPAAYGSDIRTSVFPYPFRDDQSSLILGEVAQLNALADTVTGQNKAQQGQFVKGNKTRSEYADVMQNANNRSQTISLLLEGQFFTPLKQIIKLNILQYQGGDSIYNRNAKSNITIDPLTLRKASVTFKITDGLTPGEKVINLPAYQTAMQVIGSSPQLAGAYDVAKLFSYLLKSQGADVSDFEKPKEQLAYEQAVQQWQQVAMAYADKGMEFTQPQPAPEQFGYYPAGNKPTEEQQEASEPTVMDSFIAAAQGANNAASA